MPNLKDLKIRIESVKSTQKITKAMKMVAASKLRRAQERAEEARPYSEKMNRMLTTLASNTSPDNAPDLLTGRLDENGHMKNDTHLLIVATADRGLCGGFNSSIAKAARARIMELEGKGKKVKLLTIGRKGLDQLKGLYESKIIERVVTAGKKQPEYVDAEAAAKVALSLFEAGEIDSCSIVYNQFESALVQNVTFGSLIPMDVSEQADEAKDSDVAAVYDYEPSEGAILEDLLPRNIGIQIYHSLLENAAGEHGARMTAMDNATRNAGEMINGLTLQYNRTRQAAITTELTEIISGAEAL